MGYPHFCSWGNLTADRVKYFVPILLVGRAGIWTQVAQIRPIYLYTVMLPHYIRLLWNLLFLSPLSPITSSLWWRQGIFHIHCQKFQLPNDWTVGRWTAIVVPSASWNLKTCRDRRQTCQPSCFYWSGNICSITEDRGLCLAWSEADRMKEERENCQLRSKARQDQNEKREPWICIQWKCRVHGMICKVLKDSKVLCLHSFTTDHTPTAWARLGAQDLPLCLQGTRF